MGNIKTLWQLLQDIVEKEERRFSLYDFLMYASDDERKEIHEKLVDADSKQYFAFMDSYNFVNEDEVYCATVEYYEKTMDRTASIGEHMDLYENVDYYIREKNLQFDE